MTNVYVRPAARDLGVGSMLLNRVVAWAKDVRLEFLIVWPSERSVPFYARAGFVVSGEAMELPLEG